MSHVHDWIEIPGAPKGSIDVECWECNRVEIIPEFWREEWKVRKYPWLGREKHTDWEFLR